MRSVPASAKFHVAPLTMMMIMMGVLGYTEMRYIPCMSAFRTSLQAILARWCHMPRCIGVKSRCRRGSTLHLGQLVQDFCAADCLTLRSLWRACTSSFHQCFSIQYRASRKIRHHALAHLYHTIFSSSDAVRCISCPRCCRTHQFMCEELKFTGHTVSVHVVSLVDAAATPGHYSYD
jgi:hypothetical protein